MRSMPGTIVWEMLYRGRWQLPAGAVGACLLPMLIENALRIQGGVESTDPAQIMMHLMLVQLNMFMFGAAVISAQGNPSRLYAAPITTPTLVASHLLPGMLLVGLQTAASIATLNAFFPLNWPILGPALFGAVSIAAVNAAVWESEKSPAWAPWFLGLVALVLGLWFKMRHGSLMGQSTHYWVEVTATEFLTLLAFALLSYYAAVQGVARTRRGDTLPPLGIVAWLERVLDPPPEAGPPFGSPDSAQYWSVWRQKGWAMPLCILFAMCAFGLFWLIAIRSSQDLVMGLTVGGGLLSLAALCVGITIGNCGASDTSFDMGGFLATRPMTSRAMSRIILHATLRTVVYSWGIWAMAYAAVVLILLLLGISPWVGIRTDATWWYLPLTLLGPWIVASTGVSLGLTGRGWILLTLCCVGFPSLMAYIIITEWALSPESRMLLGQFLVAAVGVLLVLGTAWAYVAAQRRALIDASASSRAALAWVLGSILAVYLCRLHPELPISNAFGTVGALALAVAPFSTIPLALAWNRVR